VNFVIPIFYVTSKCNHTFFIQKPQSYSYYRNERSLIKVAKELLKRKRRILPCSYSSPSTQRHVSPHRLRFPLIN
jgi:hypothetical protein